MTLLEPNLASESRLLRLSTLRVLARYDPLRFEDNAHSGAGDSNRTGARDECNFLEVAEALEALPISVAAERDLMWRLGQLEVLGRSGRLPRPYAGLMATHALGLLRVKYSGVWPKAAAIVAALYQRPHQRELVWGPMHAALRKVMPPPATRHQAVVPQRLLTALVAIGEQQAASGVGGQSKAESRVDAAAPKRYDVDGMDAGEIYAPGEPLVPPGQHPSGLRTAVPPPKPWVPRLLTHAARLDGGPTEEMDLPVALQGVFRDESVRTGLQPESGEVPLWASTDADSAFAQVRGVCCECYLPLCLTRVHQSFRKCVTTLGPVQDASLRCQDSSAFLPRCFVPLKLPNPRRLRAPSAPPTPPRRPSSP